jgi:hypothetical protein
MLDVVFPDFHLSGLNRRTDKVIAPCRRIYKFGGLPSDKADQYLCQLR